MTTRNILIANGVNLDLLGRREPTIYGKQDLESLEIGLRQYEKEQAGRVSLSFFQSNEEAAFLVKLSEGWDGIVLNPGAWTHTSLALADRLAGLAVPFVEVHISNLSSRESFRQHSYCAPYAWGIVSGFGFIGYRVALEGLLCKLEAI